MKQKKPSLEITIPGFRFSGIVAGIKPNGKSDLALIVADKPCKAVAVFTTNRLKAAPVLQGQQVIRKGLLQAIVVNAGNANAATGPQGLKNAFATAQAAGQALGISASAVLVSSTGKIGVPLDVKKIERALPEAVAKLASDATPASEAIMTTDGFPKRYVFKGKLAGKTYTIAGFAKGAGMIEPHMATMLAYIFTDLDLPLPAMRRAFRAAVEASFNSISVDGDTSTNDTAILMASGASGIPCLKADSTGFRRFQKELQQVCQQLAWMMVKDGEGATKVAQIQVKGAKNVRSAKKIAYTIARSPLVKTSFFGEDPNWGRVFAALGYAGETFDPSRVDISYGPVALVRNGLPTAASSRAKAHRVMKQNHFSVRIDLKLGSAQAEVWTSDLGYEYIKINAEYN